MTEIRQPFGPNGPTWVIFWDYLGITILVLDNNDEIARVIVVFCPFCNMLFSKAGVRIDFWKLVSSNKTAKSAQWLKQFFHQLRTSYAPLVADKSFNGLAQDDILFQFDAIHLHNSAFLHMPQKPCVHITKNGLAGARQNLFHSSFTNMIKKGHFGVIGKNARAELLKLDREMEDDEGTAAIDDEVADNNDEDSVHRDEGWGDDDDVDTDDDNMMALVKSPEAERKQQRKVVRDTMFKRRVASLLSNSNDEASFNEALDKAIVYLKHDKRGEKMTPGEINKRITLFIKSGLIHGELLRRFENEVNSKKQNKGNTTSHRTRDIETTKKVDNILEANPEQKFFIQAEGKATVGALQ